MSAEDVEMVRANFEALAEGGYEAILPMVHPEFEMETLPGLAAEPQVYRGPEGVRRWWESFYEVMDEVTLEPTAYHDAGPGRVVLDFKLRARGQISGAETTQRALMLWRMREGKLIRIEFFADLDKALAAATD